MCPSPSLLLQPTPRILALLGLCPSQLVPLVPNWGCGGGSQRGGVTPLLAKMTELLEILIKLNPIPPNLSPSQILPGELRRRDVWGEAEGGRVIPGKGDPAQIYARASHLLVDSV